MVRLLRIHTYAHAYLNQNSAREYFIFGVGFALSVLISKAMREPQKVELTIVGLHAFFICICLTTHLTTTMTNLSNDAFAVLAFCEETKKPFGITVDKIQNGKYKIVWPFKINIETARREGYDSTSVRGSVDIDENFPGCPHCGSKQFWMCVCGHPICYHGQENLKCPNCGASGKAERVEQVDLKGGGY